ncbi:MAG: transposase [Thermoplasmatales archaeon]|nr:transposase [Thermoplasmatales archaeon]
MKHRYTNETLFYDITSIVLNGYRSALAKIGYPEFEPQINVGLCIEGGNGFPIFHDVFPGNISHKKTLIQFTERLKIFEKNHAILILDAGIAGDEEHLNDVIPNGLDVIARIPMYPRIKKLALENLTISFKDMVQLSNSKVYVKEIDRKKGKLLFCFNEKLKVLIKEKRYDEILKAIERKKKGLPIKDGIKKYLIKRDGGWKINYKEIENAERYDGIYVIYCSIKEMSKEKVVTAYFGRDRIEKCFQLMKDELEIGPLRFQIDKRIRAKIMLCYLAYLVVTNIEVRLKEDGIPYTVEKIKEILSNVYKVHIHRGSKFLERISSLTEEQKKIMGVFGLLS